MKEHGKNSNKPVGMSVKAMKTMKAKIKAQTITISAMREKFDPVTDDSGNLFGGRKEKKKAKKANTKHDSDEE